MPLTLAEYEFQIGHHIRIIHHHARQMRSHVERMTHQPGFPSLAEAELETVETTLFEALRTVMNTRAQLKAKPADV
jgi:hypothetical protein